MKKLVVSMMALLLCVSSFAGFQFPGFGCECVYPEQKYSCEVNAPLSYGLPDAKRIAADLVGVRFVETVKDGFFKDEEWYFAEDEKLTVNITNVERLYDEVKLDVTINLLTATRGRFIIKGKVGYYYGNNGWVFDVFLCHSIMPMITNAYNDFISIEHKGWQGERYLKIVNHSNIKLGVYVSLKKWLDDEIHKGCIVVEPNETKNVGGLFVGDIEEYTVHYIERY